MNTKHCEFPGCDLHVTRYDWCNGCGAYVCLTHAIVPLDFGIHYREDHWRYDLDHVTPDLADGEDNPSRRLGDLGNIAAWVKRYAYALGTLVAGTALFAGTILQGWPRKVTLALIIVPFALGATLLVLACLGIAHVYRVTERPSAKVIDLDERRTKRDDGAA